MNKHFQEVMQMTQSGQIGAALERCEKLIKKHPRETEYLLLAASIQASQNNLPGVVTCCKRALDIDPKNLSALYNIGVAYLNLADFQNAYKYGSKLIGLDKKNALALSNMGLACWHLGDHTQAITHCQAALRIDPGMATAHNNLGLAYKSLKQLPEAVSHFRQALNIKPAYADALYNLGITLLDMGDTSGNIHLEILLKLNPNYPELHNLNGLNALDAGDTARAINHFKQAIIYKNNYYEAYCNLGNALMKEKNFTGAEAMYRKAVELKPDYASAWNNLGNALMDQENYSQHYAEAEKCYLKAIDLAPQLYDAYKNLGVCYAGNGNTEMALHYYRIYNKSIPDNLAVIANMAGALERTGKFDECMELLSPYLKTEIPNIDILLNYAKIAKKYNLQQDAMNALLSINDDTIDASKRSEKYYALGKLAESIKSSPEIIFNFYKTANDLEQEKHDIKKSDAIFGSLIDYFTREKIAALQRADNESGIPIFIVGMPRSGTSLAEQILDSHPEIFGAGELHHIHHITQRIGQELSPQGNFPNNLDNMTKSYATRIAKEHLDTLKSMSPTSTHIVDKMPHNFQALGLLNLLFPKAKIVHCTRSSIDTCLSIYFQHFNKHHAYSNSLEMLGRYYNQYADLMEHWKSVLDIKMIEFNYETVIENPEIQVRQLLEFCEVDWNPACLKFNENKRTVMTPSYDQVRQPLYTSSVAKWKKYEPFIEELILHLGKRAN